MRWKIPPAAIQWLLMGLVTIIAVLYFKGSEPSQARDESLQRETMTEWSQPAIAQPGEIADQHDPVEDGFNFSPNSANSAPQQVAIATPGYTPREEVAVVHPTNYGQRFATDIHGNPVSNELIVVIHETVGSAQSAINTFQTPHYQDADQVSYHTLIKRDGTVVYLVPPEYRAFGAGNSIFNGSRGPEAVATNAAFPPSVNNFAYHTSLETPSDGRGNRRTHSGYTEAQYQSLGWLIARTSIPDNRITTHRAVDRSGSRLDPRSFDAQKFLSILHSYPRQVRENPA